MLKETKVIIDNHTKHLLNAISNQITDEIRTAFDASIILQAIDELVDEEIRPIEKKLKKVDQDINRKALELVSGLKENLLMPMCDSMKEINDVLKMELIQRLDALETRIFEINECQNLLIDALEGLNWDD